VGVWPLALIYKGTLASIEPSGNAKRIAALREHHQDLRTSIRALRKALGM